MFATIDVSDQSGKSLADAPSPTHQLETEVYTAVDQKAEEAVRRVIAANAPHGK
jgi:membrane fusion protein (multidrug efflux system)